MNEIELLALVHEDLQVLNLIHESLGVISSFIVFFIVVLLCYFAYKFFNMFF